jgi:hypothetical protein
VRTPTGTPAGATTPARCPPASASPCTFGGGTALSGLEGETVELGDVVYARQSRDGDDIGNDFGLVEIPSDAEHLVDPSMPTWGGPTERGEVNVGETVVRYGNGSEPARRS